jgi:ppGpp synthetase/RelA/SpoT-type nucleotidyltranferase
MDRYPDPIRQLTDLCGGRVIVQTLEQVEAVCRFVERHFKIVEKDDKTSHLNTDQFGYRDMHYIVQVPAGCSLAFTDEERRAIGDRRAELQVRTLVQHAWADILHDRMYKTPLRLAAEAKRTGNLLAAVLEEGDRGFNRLATDLDGMIANYSAYASENNVEKEIRVHQLLLAGETKPEQQPKLALQLARLIAARDQW